MHVPCTLKPKRWQKEAGGGVPRFRRLAGNRVLGLRGSAWRTGGDCWGGLSGCAFPPVALAVTVEFPGGNTVLCMTPLRHRYVAVARFSPQNVSGWGDRGGERPLRLRWQTRSSLAAEPRMSWAGAVPPAARSLVSCKSRSTEPLSFCVTKGFVMSKPRSAI